MELSFKLDVYEGPLDLLLHLIDKNKINIYDIPIVQITDQYLTYLEQMEVVDLDIMADFLVVAATLLELKARLLLPKEEEEEEEDPTLKLIRQLVLYQFFKEKTTFFEKKHEEVLPYFQREVDIPKTVKSYIPPVDIHELCEKTSLNDLAQLYQLVCQRKEDRIDPIRSQFKDIKEEKVSLSKTISKLKEKFIKGKNYAFKEIVEQKSKLNIVVHFLAILELAKSGEVKVSQNEDSGEIRIITEIKEEEKNEVS